MTDNGFLKLDNSIIDYWMAKLNHSEFKTLLTIYRKTVGWNKQYDRISQNQISELSGITTRSVRSAISSLEELGLIITTGKNKSARVFTLDTNKLFNVCLKSDEVIEMESKLESISNNLGFECNNDDLIAQDGDVNFLHKRHPKDTNNKKVKDTVIPDINIPFDSFWDLYDYKKSKQDCNTKWLSMSDEERQLTMDNLCTYIKSTPDKTYRKYPLNYLENEMWLDEVVLTVKDDSTGVFSASHKEFKTLISASNTVTDSTSTSTDISADTSLDLLAKSSQVHWSELKAKGLLKKQVNPSTLMISTEKQKEIDDFLNNNSSKRFDNSRDIA